MYSHFDANHWVTPFGAVFITAILSVWIYARRNARSAGIDGSHIDLLLPISVVVGVVGGTLVAMLMPMDHQVAGELMNHGVRLRLFGMLATAAVGVFIYSRLNQLSFRQLLDSFALPTLLGVMIHRTGCYFAGCCWGDIAGRPVAGEFAAQVQTLPSLSNLSSGVQYPPGSLPFEQHLAMGFIEPDALASLPVMPVQLYEIAGLAVMLLVLRRFPWREYPRGTITVIVTCGYALLRFFIGYFRADGQIVLGNLTVTQLQCLLLLVAALLLPGLLRQRHQALGH